MPTDIHLTSGETIHSDEDLATLQGKLTGDVWAVIETQTGERAAIRTDQVTHLLAHGEYQSASF